MSKKNKASKEKLQENWFGFLFSFHFVNHRVIIVSLSVMAFITALICFLQFYSHIIDIKMPSNSLTTFGMVLGLLLVFRTNTAYERWLDGRKQYGTLMNASRNFSLNMANSFAGTARKKESLALLKSFAQSISEHLLGRGNHTKELLTLTPEQQAKFNIASHKPVFLLNELEGHLSEMFADKQLANEQYFYAKKNLQEITDALGACERIKFTPIPLSYTLHLRRIVLIYCIVLPFTLVNDLGWWAIPVELIIFYALLGIELIGEEIEDPFSGDLHDLPIFDYSDNIFKNIGNIENMALNK